MTLRFRCRHTYSTGFQLQLEFESTSLVTSLVGPSGSGKTTVLQIMAGLLRPQSGEFVHQGVRLTDTSEGIFVPPEQRKIGYMFQDYQLFPHQTVEQNLRYGWKRNSGDKKALLRLIDVLALGALLHRYPRSLSGGEQQRVAFGRALAMNPRLLLLDEPLSAVDHQLQDQIIPFMTEAIYHYRIPTIWVTHDQHRLQSLKPFPIAMPSIHDS